MTTYPRARTGPTIIEVAEAARVSRQTVSNALNAPHRLRPDTLARVLAAIDALGYVPNRMARSLRTQDARQIGYLLDEGYCGPDGVVQDRFLHSLSAAAEAEGYLLLLFNCGPRDDELARYADMLHTGSVDGFVLCHVRPDDPRPVLLERRRAPFVCFGRPAAQAGDVLWVDVDASAGTEAAVDHLVAAGHRRIGFLGWPGTADSGEPRLAGWRRGLRKHGLPADACEYAFNTRDDSARGAVRLLTGRHAPTAVVTANDTLALGCYAAARQLGLEVGRELAVIGFDDSPTASLVTPTLTSIGQPLAEIGQAAMRLLATRLRGQAPERTGLLLAPTLTVRDSA